MKVTIVKKGEKFGFGNRFTADKDQHHVRGTKEACWEYAKTNHLSLDLHKVTGTMENLYYGIAD